MTNPRVKILCNDGLDVQIAKKPLNSSFEKRYFEQSLSEAEESEFGIKSKHQRVK